MKMKMQFKTKLLGVILTATILIVPIGISSLEQQQAYAPRTCGGCVEFKKLTHEFEKNVINAIGDPNQVPPSPVVRELVEAYGLDVMRIFLGGPDTIPAALILYQEGIFTLFENSPSGHKPVLNDQIKEFRQLTHAFEKAVIGSVAPPHPE